MPNAAPAEPLIECDRVYKSFGPDRIALRDLSFRLDRGEFIVLSGANGTGKSTLLELVIGRQLPDSGRVLVAGEQPGRLRGAALTAMRRGIGMVTQELHLLADRSVLENVMLPALAAGLSFRTATAQAQAALGRVGVVDDLDRRPERVSAAARRRVALARAIVNRPALLLADEPTAGLDREAAGALLQLFGQFAQAGVAVLMTTAAEPDSPPPSARHLRLVAGRISQ